MRSQKCRKLGSGGLCRCGTRFDPTYSEVLGVNINNLLVAQPDTGEAALEIVDQLVRSSAVDIRCHRLGGRFSAAGGN
jgi:hypothetical protein